MEEERGGTPEKWKVGGTGLEGVERKGWGWKRSPNNYLPLLSAHCDKNLDFLDICSVFVGLLQQFSFKVVAHRVYHRYFYSSLLLCYKGVVFCSNKLFVIDINFKCA